MTDTIKYRYLARLFISNYMYIITLKDFLIIYYSKHYLPIMRMSQKINHTNISKVQLAKFFAAKHFMNIKYVWHLDTFLCSIKIIFNLPYHLLPVVAPGTHAPLWSPGCKLWVIPLLSRFIHSNLQVDAEYHPLKQMLSVMFQLGLVLDLVFTIRPSIHGAITVQWEDWKAKQFEQWDSNDINNLHDLSDSICQQRFLPVCLCLLLCTVTCFAPHNFH